MNSVDLLLSRERVYLIFVGLIGAIFLGVILGQLRSVIDAANARSIKQEERLADFRSYIEASRMGKVSKETAIRAYIYYIDKKADIEFASSLNGIPKSLMSNMIGSAYAHVIKRIRFFSDLSSNREREFIIDLIIRAKPYEVAQGDLIAEKGDIAEELTFILRGNVQIWNMYESDYVPMVEDSASNQKFIATEKIVEGYATQGNFIGDFEFQTKSTRSANYTAFSHCDMLAISYTNLQLLIAKYKSAGERLLQRIKRRVQVFELTTKVEKFDRSEGVLLRSQLWFDGEKKHSSVLADHSVLDRKHTYQVITLITRMHVEVEVDGVEAIEEEPIDNIKIDEESKLDLYRRFIIHPDFAEKVVWDFIMQLLIFYVAFFVTTQVLFNRYIYSICIEAVWNC